MTRVPFHEPLFIKTYTANQMAEHLFYSHKMPEVNHQLITRYFAEKPSFEPTHQEKKWGIDKIDPDSCYWMHFKQRLCQVAAELQRSPSSNRAVITIDYPTAAPCFQSFQFKINKRNGLELTCFARSLDLDNGLPVDAPIFWKAALEPLVKTLRLKIDFSTLTIVSPGAHRYED